MTAASAPPPTVSRAGEISGDHLTSAQTTTLHQARKTSQTSEFACQSSQTWHDHSGTLQTEISPGTTQNSQVWEQQGACVCAGYDSEESHHFYIHRVAGAATASMIKVVLYFLVYILDALIYSLNVSLQLIWTRSSVAYWTSNLFSLLLIFGWKT